jgi:hypothetical protein
MWENKGQLSKEFYSNMTDGSKKASTNRKMVEAISREERHRLCFQR